MAGVCFISADPFVEFQLFWLAFGLVSIALSAFFYFHTTADDDVMEMFENMVEETIAKGLRKRRLNSIWKIIILSAWWLSWPALGTRVHE